MAKNWLYWLGRGGRILPGRIQSCWGKQSYRVRLAAWRMQKSSIKWVSGNMAVRRDGEVVWGLGLAAVS